MSRQNSVAVPSFEFPVEKYTKAQKKWVSRDCIIIPTLEKYILDDIEGKRLLDIGCGNGDLTHQFVKWGAEEVIGMDTSEEMINLCNAHVSGLPLKFLGKSSLEMDFVDEFDVITAIFMLQFSENVEELGKTLRNIAKALRPGGVFYAFVPNGICEINPTEQEGINMGARMILNSVPPKDGEHLKVAFYNDGRLRKYTPSSLRLISEKQVAETDITFFYRSTYEQCLREAGFMDIEWITPIVSDEGLQAHGENFFFSYLNPPKDVMFRAVLSE
ncbi:CRE-PRMT-6 protein, partial [Aphelenchoides avenae]